MYESVLLDLDNTLLINPDRTFAAAFMRAIDEHFQKVVKVNTVSQAFRKGIGQHKSHVSSQNNTHIMIDIIAEDSSLSRDVVRKVYKDFYTSSYPKLKSITSVVSTARPLVEHLINTNIPIVVATNPIYPEEAINQRLQWAGLGEFINEFSFITTSDNMVTAKPNTAYYSKILSMLNITNPERCIMVGDSLTNDIEPATKVGLQTHYIKNPSDLALFYEHVQQNTS